MATGTRLSNTQEELLRKLLPQIAEMKLSDDADPDFIAGLEGMLVAKIREPIERARAAALTAADPALAGVGGAGVGGAGGMGDLSGAMGGMGGMTGGMTGGAGGADPTLLLQALGGTQPQTIPNQRGLVASPDITGSVDELRRIMSR